MHPDRERLSRIGDVCAVLGAGLFGVVAAALTETLPPTYGKTLALWGAGAMGFVLLTTGLAYVWASRRALDPAVGAAGLALDRSPPADERSWIPWHRIVDVRIEGWKLSPWLSNPRFYQVVVTSNGDDGTPSKRAALVHLEDGPAFVRDVKSRVGKRLVAGPDASA